MPFRHRDTIKCAAVYFITTSTFDRKPFPRYPDCMPVIKEILFRAAKDKNVFIMGYVLMPTHVHLILGSKEGGSSASKFIHSFKGRVRETLQGKGKFWQDRFDDVMLFSQDQFNIKLNYIHSNPVRAGLVTKPENWKYSSYYDWSEDSREKEVCTDFEWLN